MKIIITILILIICYLLFALSEKSPYNTESFGGMKEWANLNNISTNIGNINVEKLTDNFSIFRFNDSEVLVFSSNQKKCGILLNCQYPPYYKAFGKCHDFTLTLKEFQLIRKHSNITITVQDLLSLHIE